MREVFQPAVLTFALFDKRIEGDNCLMELARRRFQEAGTGAEMHGGTPEHLAWVMQFRPSQDTPIMVHLARDLNLLEERSRLRIMDIAARFAGRVRGLVLHDHPAMPARHKEFVEAAWDLDERLERLHNRPLVFIEYAAGLDPVDFARFFAAIPDLDRICPCIDIGHVGMREARAHYAKAHRGEDICALKNQHARLPQLMGDIEAAVRSGSAAAFSLLNKISLLQKPVHFHLHDAHPLSVSGFFGLSDHLSFLEEIPLSFEYGGRRTLTPMFGPSGLSKLVTEALKKVGPRRVSFTLEIHPTRERAPLGDAGSLFPHWTDRTNAEQMNHWLLTLCANHLRLRQVILETELAPS